MGGEGRMRQKSLLHEGHVREGVRQLRLHGCAHDVARRQHFFLSLAPAVANAGSCKWSMTNSACASLDLTSFATDSAPSECKNRLPLCAFWASVVRSLARARC